MTTQDERTIARDRMRFIKNTQSSRLCYLGILFDVFFFVNIYKSDVGTYYYNYKIGLSIVYNLIFLLAAFLASEGVKNYKKEYSYSLFILGILQFVRIFIIPMQAHSAKIEVDNALVGVMGNGQFTLVCAYLIISGAALLIAGLINLKKYKELSEHLKSIGQEMA
ncbi:MAG: hypothetical protein K6A40_01965 [Solobacterium sp.]|nr:hypothetical protein [Solobacterium sp.]